MKKRVRLLLFIILSFLFAACADSQKNNDFKGMDSKAFFESITLPEHLRVDIPFEDVKQIDEAKLYKANYLNFDLEKLKKAFIKNSVTEEKHWAEGPQLIASKGDIKEYLSLYDGGRSFGIENGTDGGFAYMMVKDDQLWNKLNTVSSTGFDIPGLNAQKYGYSINTDYESGRDLDFMSYEDSLSDIKRILETAEIPPFDVAEAYSLDLETIKKHYELYLKSGDASIEKSSLSWDKEDESYLFSLRQLIDAIPVVNKSWQMPDGTKGSAWGNPMPATTVTLVYNKLGISEITAYNILTIAEELESRSLISIFEALNILIEDYSLIILEEDIRIISGELGYLSIPEADGIKLVPGWLFCSVKAATINNNTYNTYKFDAVDAVTGKLYPDRW